jgi:hypothetical protein
MNEHWWICEKREKDQETHTHSLPLTVLPLNSASKKGITRCTPSTLGQNPESKITLFSL